jgi:iron-sulfur cluster repair protein YtfE (RIC family)
MIPKTIRNELLREHAHLREMIADTRRIALRVRADDPLREELKASALRVLNDLSAHNNREEELLRAVVAAARGSGAPRTEVMNRQHFEEHRAIHAALVAIHLDRNGPGAAKSLLDALNRVVDHMAHEEEIFGSSDEWRDEDTLPGV